MAEQDNQNRIKAPLPWLRHELRTPINQIIGYSEMLQEDAEEQGQESLRDDLGKIANAARMMLSLINEHLVPFREGDTEPARSLQLGSEPKYREERKEPSVHKREEERSGHGSLLVVDDNESNRDMLSRQLVRQGYTVDTAEDGNTALERVRKGSYDLILLDIMMPGIDGIQVLEQLKCDEQLRHIPVIMISALDEMSGVVRCIEQGAEDYLPKPFDPVLLRARIGASLDKKRFRDQEQSYIKAIVETQEMLNKELAEAAEYVKSILPEPMTGRIETKWSFIPSTQLGGDAFGYHWVDGRRFALYLLDVCGHGVGAALLSISVMNLLRSQSLPGADFADPVSVVKALNERFQMADQNDQYFTIWYGVYDSETHTLCHASAGHPPAVLITGPTREELSSHFLKSTGPPTGWDLDSEYDSHCVKVERYNRFYVFSDGTYEITRADGTMMKLDEFVQMLALPDGMKNDDLDRILSFSREAAGGNSFEDDFSIVRVNFTIDA